MIFVGHEDAMRFFRSHHNWAVQKLNHIFAVFTTCGRSRDSILEGTICGRRKESLEALDQLFGAREKIVRFAQIGLSGGFESTRILLHSAARGASPSARPTAQMRGSLRRSKERCGQR